MSNTQFRVKQVTTAVIQCRSCGGVGFIQRTHRGQTFKEPCREMGCQNGKIKVEHETEVDLKTALKEMGIIK